MDAQGVHQHVAGGAERSRTEVTLNRRDLPPNFDDEGYDERGLDVDGFTRAENVKESRGMPPVLHEQDD